jgi:hypothetical protein
MHVGKRGCVSPRRDLGLQSSRVFQPSLSLLVTESKNDLNVLYILSPQFLINHHDTLKVFVTCTHKRTLHLIAMDKAHINVQHGTSFCDDIHLLWVEYFRQVFGNQPRELCPWLIALTTMF